MSSLVNQLSSSFAMSEEEEAFGYAMFLRSSGIFPYVLDAAIQLGVFDILAKAGPHAKLSSNHIASEIGTKNPGAASLLDRMLKLLACYDLVTGTSYGENGERLYELTLAGKIFFNDENRGTLALDAFSMKKIQKVHGMPFYQFKSLNPEYDKSFDTAMINLSKISLKKILEKYHGFQGITTLVDVWGGYGVTLNIIISKYPTIKGINYDLPHVVQQAPSFPGIEHVGGDMFSTVPKADTIMMKEVLHNWDDEHCLKLLKNCYEAFEEKGKVIVISHMMVEEAEASNGAKLVCQLDLYMGTLFGAKQRTAKQFESMAMNAGFSSFQLKCLAFDAIAVMEFYK
ncbi:hypothetical protein ES319_D10G223900v1 [Gossypium barbadense]|uniref:O-methyltransferase domain-containing protein n=2 Tax=Gossypium TaxID=3633 RepID=A0A5J5PY16_GOSBA|nr:hypothetical protein ES319_D10G223900v1 [Gossypium barbadense]TYG51236.1 hypothetical protein ES288_D10G241600v1 [Gossypium darwinii]